MKISNKIGQRFNRLLVIAKSERKYDGRTIWVCQCDCGNKIEVVGSNLMSGSIQSCKCLLRDLAREKGKNKIIKTHGMSKTRPWIIWVEMRRRCFNPNDASYNNYGGRGIIVCERWLKFENFWEDMKDGYSDVLTIDRINNDGNYEPGNCKWSTIKEQAANRRQRTDGRFTKSK